MNEEQRKVLELLAQGKIKVDEAERLLAAVGGGAPGPDEAAGADVRVRREPKYLRVLVEPGPGSENGDRVNIRVPFKLIRAGIKFAALIPGQAQVKIDQALQEKGLDIDLNRLSPEDLLELVSGLNDINVEVDGSDRVRIFCE